MKNIKTITISLPIEMGNEIQKMAKEEHRTISELVREAFRQYKAQRVFETLSKKGQQKKGQQKKGQQIAKKKKLKPEDLIS